MRAKKYNEDPHGAVDHYDWFAFIRSYALDMEEPQSTNCPFVLPNLTVHLTLLH